MNEPKLFFKATSLLKTWRVPTWWTCRCSACVLQRQEKDDQYRDNAANGHL